MQEQPSNDTSVFAPVCSVCKSQNETLRAVTFPFIFSVIFMTFQRAFTGIYCAKHQRRYHLLASLISATAGWLGIPYGLLFTPITLIKLARGGVVHEAESFQILCQVADNKIRTGDTQGAIRCLEEGLKLQDDPTIREKLSRLYQQQNLITDKHLVQPVWQVIAVPTLLILAMIVGLLLGLFDTLVIWLMSPLFETDVSVVVAILSWLPTVLFLFSGILICRALLKWSLNKIANTSIILGSLLSFTATSFLFYNILQGQSILRNLQAIFMFFSISPHDGIFALRSLLAHGGIDTLINDLIQGNTPGTIFVILFMAAVCLSLYVGVDLVTKIALGQNRLFQVQQSRTTELGNSSFFSWIIYGLLLFVLVAAIAVTYPGSYLNTESAFQNINNGLAQLDQNDPQAAMKYFRQVARTWPDSVTSHAYLGLGYASLDKLDEALQEVDASVALDPESMLAHLFRGFVVVGQGKYTESVEEFEHVSKVQPEWGAPHAFLAVLYYYLDEDALEQAELEKAIQYQNEDGQTISLIGSYYARKLDFKKAAEYYLRAIKISNDPQDYIFLARTYVDQNEFEKAQKIIEEADRLGAEPASVYLAKSSLAISQKDLTAAEKLLQAALKEIPNDSDLWTEISFIHFAQGKFDSARSDAEKALELNPYDFNAHIELAFAYQQQGKKTDALTTAQRAVALLPKNDRAHYVLGLSYMDNSMNAEAVQEFETFLDLYWDRPFTQEYKKNAETLIEQLK